VQLKKGRLIQCPNKGTIAAGNKIMPITIIGYCHEINAEQKRNGKIAIYEMVKLPELLWFVELKEF
jgi:hypothetical protein